MTDKKTLKDAMAEMEASNAKAAELKAKLAPELIAEAVERTALNARLAALPQKQRRQVLDAAGLKHVSAAPEPITPIRGRSVTPPPPPANGMTISSQWLKPKTDGQFIAPDNARQPQTTSAQQADTEPAPVVVPAWEPMAVKRAIEIIERQRKKDLYPPQNDIADEIAKEFRAAGVVGAGGKPLTGAYIKRHALNGISSEQGKQLSTATSRGK